MTRVWEPGWQDLSNWHLTSKGPGFGGGVSWAVLGYQRPGVESLRAQTSGPYGTGTMTPAKSGLGFSVIEAWRSLGCDLGPKKPRFRNGLGHRGLRG